MYNYGNFLNEICLNKKEKKNGSFTNRKEEKNSFSVNFSVAFSHCLFVLYSLKYGFRDVISC